MVSSPPQWPRVVPPLKAGKSEVERDNRTSREEGSATRACDIAAEITGRVGKTRRKELRQKGRDRHVSREEGWALRARDIAAIACWG